MSTVYFVDANVGQESRPCEECGGKGCNRCGGTGRQYEITPPEPLPLALYRLLNKAGIADIIDENDKVAIKIHSGEHTNHRLTPPVLYEPIVKRVTELGGKPFITDTNTVYTHSRYEGIGHYLTAWKNGYALFHMGAPFIVADGLVGTDAYPVQVEGDVLQEVYVASAIYQSDVLISVDHTTMHPAFGLGGNIKNLGMGAVSKQTKIQIHHHEIPYFDSTACIGCGDCALVCPGEAIHMENRKAVMDQSKCWGCRVCMEVCPNDAIKTVEGDMTHFFKGMADACAAVLKRFPQKFLAINIVMDVTLDCDCPEQQGRPVVADIGILGSKDIVAIDKASLDLIRSAPKYPLSVVADLPQDFDLTNLHRIPKEFSFEKVLEYMEAKDWGTTEYDLIKLERHRASLKERTKFSPELGYFEKLRAQTRKRLERKKALTGKSKL